MAVRLMLSGAVTLAGATARSVVSGPDRVVLDGTVRLADVMAPARELTVRVVLPNL